MVLLLMQDHAGVHIKGAGKVYPKLKQSMNDSAESTNCPAPGLPNAAQIAYDVLSVDPVMTLL